MVLHSKWLLVLLCLASCKKAHKADSGEVSALIADSCAQNPMNFFEEEAHAGHKIYAFGTQDSAFRAQLEQLRGSYASTGRDLKGAEKLAFISSYLPHFTRACTNFFAPVIETCKDNSIGSNAWQKCVSPYNKNFRQYLTTHLQAGPTGLVDLESLPVSKP